MPYSATINTIYMTVANSPFTAFANINPHIILATALIGRNTFTLLPETRLPKTISYTNGSTYPANMILSATRNNIRAVVAEGTRVAICGQSLP